MKKVILCTFVMILLFSCTDKAKESKEEVQEVTTSNPLKDSLTTKLETLNDGFFNGLAVAIVSKEGVLYKKGLGYADVYEKRAYLETTVQPIASVSKTFIGVSLLKAQELGLLKLDDPINTYLPFEVIHPKHSDVVITIRHLATHTSAIVDNDHYYNRAYVLEEVDIDTAQVQIEDIPQSFNPKASRIPLADFLENYWSKQGDWKNEEPFSENKPGALFEYTNVGASLAAFIVERASGMTYAEFTQKHILDPLEMTNSGWRYRDIDASQLSKLYASPDKQIPFYSLITYPDGGFLTNVNDLSKYLHELIKGYNGEGKVLTSESYKELFRKQLEASNFKDRDPNHPYDDEYNTGVFMGFSAFENIGHTGGDPGTSALLFFNAEEGIGRILMVNTNIENQEGVNAYYAMYNALGEYAERLK